MEALKGSLRTTYLSFFGSHIVFTILLDGQVLLPSWLYPKPARDMLTWYAGVVSDPLMDSSNDWPWFKSLIATELVFQLPFFFFACRNLLRHDLTAYSDNFRCASIAYGASTATTLVPILAVVWTAPTLDTVSQRLLLIAIYLPYLVLPVWFAWIAATRPAEQTKSQKKE